MNILYRLKQILNTYTDKELKEMDLWVNSLNQIESIYIDEHNINLITEDAEVRINNYVDKEGRINLLKQNVSNSKKEEQNEEIYH